MNVPSGYPKINLRLCDERILEGEDWACIGINSVGEPTPIECTETDDGEDYFSL